MNNNRKSEQTKINQVNQKMLHGAVAAGVCHPLFTVWDAASHRAGK